MAHFLGVVYLFILSLISSSNHKYGIAVITWTCLVVDILQSHEGDPCSKLIQHVHLTFLFSHCLTYEYSPHISGKTWRDSGTIYFILFNFIFLNLFKPSSVKSRSFVT